MNKTNTYGTTRKSFKKSREKNKQHKVMKTKSIILTLSLLIGVNLVGFAQGDSINSTLIERSIINEAINRPENFTQITNKDFPIGTIIPYIPYGFNGIKLQLPYGWAICAGQVVYDKTSPLYLKKLPDLINNTFIMGTMNYSNLGEVSGSNEISTDGNHTHGLRKLSPHNSGFGNDNADDQFLTDSQGAHNHGGDKKPKHCGVLFLIRYK